MLIRATALSDKTTFTVPGIGPTDEAVQFPTLTWDQDRGQEKAIFKWLDKLAFKQLAFDPKYNILIKSFKYHHPNLPGLDSIKRSSTGTDTPYRLTIDVRRITDDSLLGVIDIPFIEIGKKIEINRNFQPFNGTDLYYLAVQQSVTNLRYDARNIQSIYSGIDIFGQVELEIESMEF